MALDLSNIQGDILLGGLPKKTQTFFFFRIDKDRSGAVDEFRKQLSQLIPLITFNDQSKKDHDTIDNNKGKGLLKISGVNLAFTQEGLATLGISDSIGDDAFTQGMRQGAEKLGDLGSGTGPSFDPAWFQEFKNEIHGVFLITGDQQSTVDEQLARIKTIVNLNTGQPASINQVISVVGNVREGEGKKGHEHFGYLDGISQPAVQGVDITINKGQDLVKPGVILLGRDGDSVSNRPSWAQDGSFLAFRYLSQLVPEFDAFKGATAQALGLDEELLGARLTGRWKSGAPIDVTPFNDDPALGIDSTRNDDFSFNVLSPDDQTTQNRCPFAAHVRKTNPRDDLNGPFGAGTTSPFRIIRSGIPFGPEVTDAERSSNTTINDRGLLFVSYQSNISKGFQFIQQSWANTPNFPPKPPSNPSFISGIDPIIGQAGHGGPRQINGANPKDLNSSLDLPVQWVIPKGGEYFFSPSKSALQTKFAKA